MNTGPTDTAAAHYLEPDRLQVGVFVMIELPWFKHPFAMNNFKIRSEDQLREVRALRLGRYRVDPARSDVPLGPESGSAQEIAAPPPDKTPNSEDDDPAALARKERMEAIAMHREHVDQVEKAFVKATAVMKSLNRNLFARPKETLNEIGVLIDNMVEVFLSSPESTLHVMGDKAGGEEVYFHSLNVAILSLMLAKELGFTAKEAHILGVGAMLHDLGLSEIPDRIAKKSPAEFTNAERNLRASHVDLGVTMGQRIGLPPEALALVAQHHEMADGSGYPKGLKEAAMTPAARLVSMVNFYDNLCNPADIHKAMTPHEALSFMFAQRHSKFEARALQLMIRSLGVYPPGSVVQLSNQALALVTSVNPKKPLRPWVMVYDESVDKKEAMMINLEVTPEINIIKSLRPGVLPPKVAAYLSPRKRVTYFFDAGTNGSDRPTGSQP
jgi:putative nucleotidyltransferase with HDIG domain